MNSDLAYLCGLLIGGGVFPNDTTGFYIKLPYQKWGDVAENPQRAGQIAKDIITLIKPILQSEYGIDVTYETGREWRVRCTGNYSKLREEFDSFQIKLVGELKRTAVIEKLLEKLVDRNLKRRFIAGLADTIGSTARSHRRYTDDHQIISFEVLGYNYALVASISQLLHSINCYPDQILWNHPNQHARENSHYKQWNKGFKIRVTLDQFSEYGAFGFTSKAVSAKQNARIQNQQNHALPCRSRPISIESPAAAHPAINSPLLPPTIRGGHYIHNKHYCAVLKCPYAPYEQLDALLKHAEDYICPFTVFTAGSYSEVRGYVEKRGILRRRVFTSYYEQASKIVQNFNMSSNRLLFGNDNSSGYPFTKVMDALAYLFGYELNMLKGKRPIGGRQRIIRSFLELYPEATVEYCVPDLLSVLIIRMNDNACMIGARNPNAYKKLISFDPSNKYKMLVREITEDDLLVNSR